MKTSASRSRRERFGVFKRRVLIGIGFGAGGILVAVLIIVGSVWVENRYPSDDAQRALLPRAQRMVTKRVVNVLSQVIEDHVRARAEVLYMSTGLTIEETIARFLDERVDLAQRRLYAYRLARVGSPEAIAALLKVFENAPADHKAAMAQLIGSTGNPAAKAWLWPLLEDKDPRVVIGAVQGLSAIGGEDVTKRVADILSDGQRTDAVRIQSALALGTIGTSSARTALVTAFGDKPSNDLATQILTSLGQFDFSVVGTTFEQFLSAPETPPAMRVSAVEALANSSTDALPLLLDVTQRDGSADVRAAAAWSISAHDTVNHLGPALAELAEREPASDVRRRLYEALLPQSEIPAERLLPLVSAEQDIAARVAGFNVIGLAIRQQPASAIAEQFHREMVPELMRIATGENNLNIQMRAVFALRRAQTAEAQAALAVIASKARPQVATAARNGLRILKG